jgi:hypothetical protein
MHRENDVILEDAHRLFVGPGDQLVRGLDQLIRAEHFGGMETAVEPDDRLAFLRQRLRLRVGEPLALREAHRDLLVPREVLEILGSRDDRSELRPSLGRLAELDDLHPVRLGVRLLPVRHELVVIRQPVVVADIVAEELLRRRHVSLRARGRRENNQRRDGDATSAECPH